MTGAAGPVRADDKTGLGQSPQVAVVHDRPALGPTVGSEHRQWAYRGDDKTGIGDFGQVAQVHDRPALGPTAGDVPIQVVNRPDGFDWGDAGIGAGALFGLMLLGAIAMVASRHLSRPATV